MCLHKVRPWYPIVCQTSPWLCSWSLYFANPIPLIQATPHRNIQKPWSSNYSTEFRHKTATTETALFGIWGMGFVENVGLWGRHHFQHPGKNVSILPQKKGWQRKHDTIDGLETMSLRFLLKQIYPLWPNVEAKHTKKSCSLKGSHLDLYKFGHIIVGSHSSILTMMPVQPIPSIPTITFPRENHVIRISYRQIPPRPSKS